MKYRTSPRGTFNVYISSQTANEFAAFKCAYAHTGESFGGVKRLEEPVLDEMLVHADAIVFDFYHSRAIGTQQTDRYMPALAGSLLCILNQVFEYGLQAISVTC